MTKGNRKDNRDRDRENAIRLAHALKNEAGPAEIRMMARLFNYQPEQLQEDIESLWRMVYGLND